MATDAERLLEMFRAERQAQAKIRSSVMALGGDQQDIDAILSGDPSSISESFSSMKLTPENRALVDELVGNAQVVSMSEAQKLLQQIRASREQMITPDDLNAELSGLDRVRVPLGRGLSAPARWTGLSAPENEMTTAGLNKLSDESLVAAGSEIVGEALPFLPLGLTADMLKSFTARVLAVSGLGALESAAVIGGKGGDAYAQTVGAGVGGIGSGLVEAFLPKLGRGISWVFRKLGKKQPRGPLLTPEGTPTPEFQQALDDAGVRFEDLVEESFAKVNVPNVRPEDAARAARFESQGIPATRGDITQDFAQQAEERRLMGSAVADSGAEFRDLKVKQSRAFEDSVGRFVDDLGIPQEAGDSIKAGLMGRKKAMVRDKNKYYRMAGEVDDGSLNIPLFKDNLLEALPDAAKARRIGRLVPTQKDALDDLLVEFGLDTSEEAVEAFDGQIMNLTVGNFNEFRAAINQIERSDQTGAISVLTGPIKEALDKEVKLLDANLKLAAEKAGKEIDETAIDLVRQGNKATLDLKTEFDPKRMTSILIDNATKSTKPKVESSKVVEKLLIKSTPVEEVRRVVGSLAQAGDAGTKAIQDLRAQVVLNALENSMKANTRQLDGQKLMGGAAFAKYLDNVGDDKLKAIFGTDELARLKALKQSALDIEGSALATPKGSADVNMDIVRATVNSGMFGRALAQFAAVLKHFSKPVVDSRATQRALNNSPRLLEQTRQLADAYPSLATVLGVPTALAIYDGEEDE